MNQHNKSIANKFDQNVSSQEFSLWAKRLYLSGRTLFKKFSDDVKFLENGGNRNELPYLDLLFPSLMLYGMAIENLLKSLIIKNVGSLFQNGKMISKYRTHDLNKLYKYCGLNKLNYEEAKMLESLSVCVYWAGKYPAPIDIQKIKKVFSLGTQISFSIINTLYKRLLSEVEKQELI